MTKVFVLPLGKMYILLLTNDEEVVLPPEQAAAAQWLTLQEDVQVQAAVTKLESSAELPMGDSTTQQEDADETTKKEKETKKTKKTKKTTKANDDE